MLLKLADTHRVNFDHLEQDHVMLKTESIFSLVFYNSLIPNLFGVLPQYQFL